MGQIIIYAKDIFKAGKGEMEKRKIRLIDDMTLEVAKQNNLAEKTRGQNMGEAHGMVIARLSQSPKLFSEIIREILTTEGLNREKVIEFHKRITIGIGHHSIEQHAYTGVGFENMSILAANKHFENKRLGAYLERSTRYQDFSKPSYYIPKELNETQKEEYNKVMKTLFDAYTRVLPKIIEEVRRGWEEKGALTGEANIRKKAFDCARYLLPAGTHTNFAMTTNSQTFRSLIHDLLSEGNLELEEAACELQKELEKVYPALCASEYCTSDAQRKEHKNKEVEIKPKHLGVGAQKIIAGGFEFENTQGSVQLINSTTNAEEIVIYEYLVKEGFDAENKKGKTILDGKAITTEQKKELMKKIFSYNKAEGKPHRAAELATYCFDTIVDFGAGRDLHRNRMLTWIETEVSPEYGFAMPYYLTEEVKKEYIAALKIAFEFWVKLIKSGVPRNIAQYCLPLGTNYKVLYTVNARELHHVAKTRTTKHAHYSYREYVHKMCEEVKKVNPLIGEQMPDRYEKEC